MAQTTLSVRMDEEVKKQFDAFCSAAGMNTSVAINLFAKAVLREHRIPFEIAVDPIQQKLKAAQEQIDTGETIAWEEFSQQVKEKYEL